MNIYGSEYLTLILSIFIISEYSFIEYDDGDHEYIRIWVKDIYLIHIHLPWIFIYWIWSGYLEYVRIWVSNNICDSLIWTTHQFHRYFIWAEELLRHHVGYPGFTTILSISYVSGRTIQQLDLFFLIYISFLQFTLCFLPWTMDTIISYWVKIIFLRLVMGS